MARFWKEQYKPTEHFNQMHEISVFKSPNLTLIPSFVYFVSVCSFTFEFHSTKQIEACLNYYSEKNHDSSRRYDTLGGDHWEFQRWFERLSMYLLEEPKRQKVVKALAKALKEFGE
jgi:hypothetical protein